MWRLADRVFGRNLGLIKKTSVSFTVNNFHDYENIFKARYEQICNQLNLKYLSVEADSINIKPEKNISKKFISPLILNESNYYKDMILKIEKVKKILDN